MEKTKIVVRKCVGCGKTFKRMWYLVRRSKRQFCSLKCFWENQGRTLNVECDYCGKIFKREISKMKRNTNNFCSSKCFHKFDNEREEVKCNCCGKVLLRWRGKIRRNKHHFCDRKCMAEWQRENVDFIALPPVTRGKDHIQYISKCKICGKPRPPKLKYGAYCDIHWKERREEINAHYLWRKGVGMGERLAKKYLGGIHAILTRKYKHMKYDEDVRKHIGRVRQLKLISDYLTNPKNIYINPSSNFRDYHMLANAMELVPQESWAIEREKGVFNLIMSAIRSAKFIKGADKLVGLNAYRGNLGDAIGSINQKFDIIVADYEGYYQRDTIKLLTNAFALGKFKDNSVLSLWFFQEPRFYYSTVSSTEIYRSLEHPDHAVSIPPVVDEIARACGYSVELLGDPYRYGSSNHEMVQLVFGVKRMNVLPRKEDKLWATNAVEKGTGFTRPAILPMTIGK